jgi:aminoglycoside phosphotransferase (APT) family kinase protein
MPRIPPQERYNQRQEASRISMDQAREWVTRFFPIANSVVLERISGGYSNANFVFTHKNKKMLLRIFPTSRAVAERESAVLKLAAQSGIKVPKLIDWVSDSSGAAAIHEFIEGELFLNVLESSVTDRRKAFAEIGAELARIHAIRFPKPGIFSSTGEVKEFPDGSEAGLRYLNEFLAGLTGKRLGPELTQALLNLIDKEWHFVRESSLGSRLVHCDFNPKNILMRSQEVAAILDWEFAIVADPLIDFGNFFRFSEDYTAVETDSFLNGYTKAGGTIPTHWRRSARLHDLVSMCAFLAETEERPNSFRTARLVIEETIKTYQTEGVPL